MFVVCRKQIILYFIMKNWTEWKNLIVVVDIWSKSAVYIIKNI